MYTTILYTEKDGLATITLNRPERYNAFIDEMNFELQKVFKNLAKKPDVRVVVLTGAGKAFCSGQDLKSIEGKLEGRNLGESVEKRYNPMIKAMHKLPKPIICKLNGVAAGAGCSLALACDLIIASEKASLIEVFANIGLVLDSGSSYFLPREIGMKKAFELCTMAPKIGAQQAMQLGLVNAVVPPDELDEATQRYIDHYAKAPTKAIGLIKKMLNRSHHSTLNDMLQYEAYCQQIAGQTEDYKEGVMSFMEKRKPNFKGK